MIRDSGENVGHGNCPQIDNLIGENQSGPDWRYNPDLPSFRLGRFMNGIAAILPAFNEEVAIGSVILRTRRYADRMIVVDDGSSDRIAEVAGLGEAIRHHVNRGKGAAYRQNEGVADSNCGFHLYIYDMTTPLITQKFSGDYPCP